ncbi:MAG: helix-turn-helix transcriptional regulator [Chloroflexi bacterium]|nr:MAG: helix-turn-helix transcriptional regulator [Chloroflexota bacterium]
MPERLRHNENYIRNGNSLSYPVAYPICYIGVHILYNGSTPGNMQACPLNLTKSAYYRIVSIQLHISTRITQSRRGEIMERAQLSTATGKERPELIAARERMNLSLQQVGKYVGVTRTTVYRWEKEGDTPRSEHLLKLRELFGMSAAALGFPEIVVDTETTTDEAKDDALATFREEDPAWRIQKIVWGWPRNDARYHVLQVTLILELEDNSMEDITRRSVIRHLALAPIDILKLSAACAVFRFPAEDILAHCTAGIVACWSLRHGTELALADDIVSYYIPTLKEIVRTAPVVQRKVAADLLAQCYLLRSLLAGHLARKHDKISYAQQAEKYSVIAESLLLQVTALRIKASAYWYTHQYKQALHAALQAKHLLDERDKQDKQKTVSSRHAQAPLPKLLYSYVYAGLASFQARDKQEESALLSLKKAHETFFSRPPDEIVPIWINHSIGTLLLNDGGTHALLGNHKAAADSLSQIETKHAQDMTIPFSCRVEAMIDQAIAEAKRTDHEAGSMERCILLWKTAIEGAKTLKSDLFDDAIRAHAAMCAAWPGETDVSDLDDLIVHW